MATTDFQLKPSTPEIRNGKQVFFVPILPPPGSQGCKIVEVKVNGKPVKDGDKSGNVEVTNLSLSEGFISLRAPLNEPPIKVEFKLKCANDQIIDLITDAGMGANVQANPVDATKGFLDGLINVFKGFADFLAGPFKDLPGDLREGLKKIKGLVAKGLDIVSNLLPLAKGLSSFTPAGALAGLLPDNLDHLKKKIGEHLKDLDPLDDSREAVLADAEALRALILEDIIPYVQQVGDFAMNDLQQYTQRLSVMNKMTARLGDQLDMLGRSTKSKGKKK